MASSYLYGITDDKYVRSLEDRVVKKYLKSGVEDYKYRTPALLKGRQAFDPHDISIVFKTSPETLLHLSAKVMDDMPLPSVFSWTIEDICVWLRQKGYYQYQNTFRENYVNGRTFLLLDAAALCAMNIKDFEHIRDIAYGIRCLYFYEVTKYGRSLSLPPEHWLEHYKLYRVKNGTKYDNTKRSDLWRRMQLLREPKKYLDHWGTLEAWLNMEREPKYTELFGGVRRTQLYRCKQPKVVEVKYCSIADCKCMPPCQCHWTESDTRPPWRHSNLPIIRQDVETDNVLPLLQTIFPHKYGYILREVHEATWQERVPRFKANRSFNASLY